MLDRETIKQIKEQVPLIGKMREYGIQLVKDGNHYRCPSFLHAGKNPSSVIVDGSRWYSFSDGRGGDVIDFVAQKEFNGDRGAAIRRLASEIGINVSQEDGQSVSNGIAFMEGQIKQFHMDLGAAQLKYLHDRKITDRTINTLMIGYDRNRNRITIPSYQNGHVTYWIGRTMGAVSKTNPKYFKPPLNHYRENSLWGLDTLSRDTDTLVVAEGAFDFLSLWQEGYATVSICGGTYSAEQTKTLLNIAKRYRKVILTFDHDDSGRMFNEKLAVALFRQSTRFSVARMPDKCKDISDAYVAGHDMRDVLKDENCTSGAEFIAEMYHDDFDGFYQLIDELSPYLSKDYKKDFSVMIAMGKFGLSKDDVAAFRKVLRRGKSDREYAMELISDCGGHIRYNRALGVYIFNGRCWDRCQPEAVKKRILEVCNPNMDAGRVNKVYQTVCNLTVTDDLPDQKNVLNLRNGTLYLDEVKHDSGGTKHYYTFRHGRNPGDFCTYVLNYDYDPDASSAELMRFFETITYTDQDDQKLAIVRLQEYMGSVFFSDNRLQKAYLLYGSGSNGKSAYIRLIQNMLGGEQNCAQVPMDKFMDPFSIIQLLGKRVNFCNEAKSDVKGCESQFKQITAGDTVSGCYKGLDYVSFTPRCKIFISCNELPKARDLSEGWYRRFSPFAFNARFTVDAEKVDETKGIFHADTSLFEKFSDPSLLSAALNFALAGYEDIIRRGMVFNGYTGGDELIGEMRDTSNNVRIFFREDLWEYQMVEVKGGFERIHSNDLYSEYMNWCDRNRYGYHFNPDRFICLFKKELDQLEIWYEHKNVRIGRDVKKGLSMHTEDVKGLLQRKEESSGDEPPPVRDLRVENED